MAQDTVGRNSSDGEGMTAWFDRASFLCLCGFILVLPMTIAGVEIFASLACLFFL